jgi:hypothetical protein
MNETFSEIFSIKFFVINIVIGVVISILANLLTPYIASRGKNWISWFFEYAHIISGWLIFPSGVILGIVKYTNSNWIYCHFINLRSICFLFFGIGVIIYFLSNKIRIPIQKGKLINKIKLILPLSFGCMIIWVSFFIYSTELPDYCVR